MKLGARLYALSRRRRSVGISLVVAIVACACTLYQPSVMPPGLHHRGLTIGAASTELLIATPNLAVGGPGDYLSLVNRGILIGNVMVSAPVLDDVGRALGISPSRIQATAPMTANVPRTLIEPGSGSNATALVASPDQYKLEIQADPSVPILHVYAQAPSAGTAIVLARAAVSGVISYISHVQAAGNVPRAQQVRVERLGPVTGGTANPGAPMQIAMLVFVAAFAISLWVTVLFDSLRRGWVAARLDHQLGL